MTPSPETPGEHAAADAAFLAEARSFLDAHATLRTGEGDWSNGPRDESEVAQRTAQLREALLDTLHRLTYAAELRDTDTYTHLTRISHYTALVARKLGLAAGRFLDLTPPGADDGCDA